MRIKRSQLFRLTLLSVAWIFVLGAAGIVLPEVVHAQAADFGLQAVDDQGLGLSNQPLDVTIVKLIRILLGFLGLLAVIIVLYGGYMYMTAAGNEDRISRAKLILRNGVIGLVIILFSLGIVQFLIGVLSDATGINEKDPTQTCQDLQTCNTNSCFLNTFGVQSITPSQDATGMNNIVIRAVFSKGVLTPADQALTISFGTVSTIDLTDEFTYTYVPDTDRKVIEAVYTFEDGEPTYCNDADYEPGTACIPVDDDRPYHVEVNDNIVALDGEGIKFGQVCEDFNSIQKIDFTVDQEVNDTVLPTIHALGVVNADTEAIYTEEPPYLIAGRSYLLQVDTDDNNGIGYVHLNIQATEDPADSFDIYRGPPAGVSSADPYTLLEEQFYSGGITRAWGAPKEYLMTATVWDIDHNSVSSTSSFVLLGEHCANGKHDAQFGETGVDEGGSCGKPNQTPCTHDKECASGKCVDLFCVAYPKITDVDPMDGAPGNWVTVFGEYFGYTEGTIEFGSDAAGWVKADLVQCPGILQGGTWHDSFAIVEVPEPVLEPNVEVDGAIALDGNGYIDLISSGNGPGDAGWTFGTWVQLADADAGTEQVLLSVGTLENYVQLSFTDEKKVVLSHVEAGSEVSSASGEATNLFDDQAWAFVAVSERPSDGAKIVHINDVQYFFSMGFDHLNFESDTVPFIRLGQSPGGQATVAASFDEVLLVPSYGIGANLYTQLLAGLSDGADGSSTYEETVLALNPAPVWYWRLGDASVTSLKEEIFDTQNGGAIVGNADMQQDGIFGPSTGADAATQVAIRITTAGGVFSDTTVDAFGPQPGNNDGLFTYNEIERPGLCAVVADGVQGDVNDGDLAGPPGTRIRAHGTGFATQEGGDQLLFDIAAPADKEALIAGETTDWTEQLIRSSIPINFLPGDPRVRIKKGTEDSNAIPFTVTEADLTDAKPIITDIDPEDPTPGSFITIYGNNFGVAGVVYITKQKGATCSFNDPNDGCTELALPGAPCLNTWTNTQIIAEIEEQFDDFGTYHVIVERADNHLQSDGLIDIISVQDGEPKPSICELSPVQGPAPLPESHDGLVFKGKNFTTSPILYFWNGSETFTSTTEDDGLDTDAWIGWDGSKDSRWNVNDDGTQIISSVGEADGISLYPTMPVGQWPISIKANSVRGNSVKYFVTDCRTQSEEDAPDSSYTCCTEGPDTGSWKQICDGEVRSSGYVYRFTTDILANKPYVLTQCDEEHWFEDQDYDGKNPSPIPSIEWEQSENMCLNATVQVAFSMGLDQSTISTDSVFVYECGSTDDDIDCTYDDEDLLTNLDLIYEPGEEPLLIIKQGDLSGEANFAPDTWHRVVLTTDITSVEQSVGAGELSTEPLLIDAKLSDNNELNDFDKGTPAFYYDFQTGTGFCTLNSAFITPKEKTVTKLGLIMDLWYPELPFYYYIKGKADRKCTVLDVDDLGWEWSSNKSDRAEVTVSQDAAEPPKYTDTRAIAEAKLHTPKPDGVTFSAKTPPSESLEDAFPPEGVIEASTSTLFINLGKPQVVYFEPNCAEACPNGLIFAEFNRHMDPLTFTKSTIILSKCSDPNCLTTESVEYEIENKNSLDPDDWLYVEVKPTGLLENDEFYKVELTNGIKSLGSINPPIQDEESLKPHEWVFRTKADGTLCAVDRVDVSPHPFVATYIGQKEKFTATPYGAPGECSPRGQKLSMWDYGYQWSSADTAVAEVTTFGKSFSSKQYCSQTCLPLGSDISFEYKDERLCGNGIVDPGEDCDIAANGEVVGLTCTLDCRRPGTSATYCGNGVVDNPTNPANNAADVGEVCDPTAENEDGLSYAEHCTNSCILTGSSDVFDPAVAGFCGDGKVGINEACDIAITLEDALDEFGQANKSQVGCNISCLHAGTSLAAAWCEDDIKKDAAIASGYVTEADVLTACSKSRSVCGNGILELGEQCERTSDDDIFCSPSCLYYDGDMSDNEEENGQIGICGTQYEQCTAGEEGCTEFCSFAGSSLFYSTPSACGDGVDGIGEEKTATGELVCEIPGASSGANSETQSPLQLTTAIGEGTVTSGTQKTTIDVKMPGQSKDGSVVQGSADYTLQCGFTEFSEPQNGFYNDCALPPDGTNPDNILGVGYNSCCYPRPTRVSEYPLANAGFGNEEPVCRNTYIQVVFDKVVDPASIADNAHIARGYETFENCAALGAEDVTDVVNEALDIASGISSSDTGGFWSRLWNGVKSFFLRFFGMDAYAKDVLLSDIKTWCTTDVVLTTNMYEPSETVPLYISNLIGEDTEHTAYAVLLDGGAAGITDVAGVGMKHQTKTITNDAWAFEVGTKICKIDDVIVDPESYLFSQPNTSTDVGADARTDTGQLIVPTPPYLWSWAWQPQTNTVFDIPVDGFPADSQFTKLGSTNVEGTLDAVAQAIVSVDLSPENNHTGKIFEGQIALTSMFCENPWPAVVGNTWAPYTDDTYQFSFSYCADAGASGNTQDDLPFIDDKPIDIVFGGSCSVSGDSCTTASECPNYMMLGSRPFIGEGGQPGICEMPYEGSQWQLVQDMDTNGALGTTYYAFGCSVDSDCKDESRYLDEITGGYYPLLLPSVDVSTLDLSNEIAEASCNTSYTFEDQQCTGYTAGSLKKTLFVSDTNQDGLGVQVFENPNRLSAAAWFTDRFPSAAPPQQVEIAGYDAVADQDNYYVNALNVVRDADGAITGVYNNIYLFSITQGAQASTRDVFDQILDSLEFNINLTDHGYCIGADGETPDYINACSTNFDCLLGLTEVTLVDAEPGMCAADALGAWELQGALPATVSHVDFIHALEGYVSGNNYLGKTLDGGETWVSLGAAPGSSVRDMKKDDTGVLWLVEALGVWRQEAEGADWEKMTSQTVFGDVNMGTYKGIAFQDQTTLAYGNANTKEGLILGSDDNGQTWTLRYVSPLANSEITDLEVISDSNAIAVGTNGLIARTTDGGTTWDTIDASVSYNFVDLAFSDTTGFALGLSRNVIRTTDGGITWEDLGLLPGTGSTQAVVIKDTSEVWVFGSDSTMFVTNDGGQTWEQTALFDSSQGNILAAATVGNSMLAVGQNGLVLSYNAPGTACTETSECSTGNSCVGAVDEQNQSYTSLGCHAEKTMLARDWERLHDVRDIQSALGTGGYPELGEGTFRKNYVASVWPSWGAFGSSVGQNLPQDPINTWDGCDPADPQTCWDAAASAFICPQHASVYEYEYDEDTQTYSLHVPMEFFTDESFIEESFSSFWIDLSVNTPFVIDPFAFTTERSCVPGQAYTFVASQCGDGVVGPGEECDPPGKTVLGTEGAVEAQVGNCSFHTDIECVKQTDCPYYKSVALGGGDVQTLFSAANDGDHCQVKKNDVWYYIANETASDQETDTYELFPCTEDSQCLDSSTYGTNDISIHAGIVFYPVDPEYPSEALTSSDLLSLIAGNQENVRCYEPPVEFFSGQACDGGISGSGEQQCVTEPIPEYATKTCTETCEWDYGICKPLNECGNGIVDAGEACDDGALNGTYGHCAGPGPTVTDVINTTKACTTDDECNDGNACNLDRCIGGFCNHSPEVAPDCSATTACQELHYQSCGNGIIDYDASGNAIEFCDWGIDGTHTYSYDQETSCRWDCQGYGSYCGDGFVDLANGEACDDGNSENWDGCSSFCQEENLACRDLQPHYEVDTESNKTYIYISEGNYTNFADFGGSMIESCFEDTATYICNTFGGMSCLDVEVSNTDGEFSPFQDNNPCDGNLLEAIYGAYSESTASYRIVCEGEFSGYPTDAVGLCGNGVTNDGETCDDGNQEDGDGCSASCFIEGGCGNGIRDFNDLNENGIKDNDEEYTEQCDLSVFGTKSFADCEAELGYGDPACVYCTEQCLVEVKEPPGQCGDGKFDVIGQNEFGNDVYEACELSSEGDIKLTFGAFFNGAPLGQVVSSCKEAGLGEFGPIACINSCTVIDDSKCYTCGKKFNGAVTNVSMLNAMVGPDAQWNFPISARIEKRDLNGDVERMGYMNPSDHLSVSSIYQDWIVPNPSKHFFTDIETGEDLRVESNADCTATGCAGDSCSTSGYQVTFGPEKFEGQDIVDLPGAHAFSYEVTGEPFAELNEYIVSPPVPDGVMRVVIRWEKETLGDTVLRGGFYSASKFGGSQDVLLPGTFYGDWCTEITSGNNQSDAYDGYGWPGGPSCQHTNDVIWPHDVATGDKYGVQAFTLDLNELSMASEPVAFFVQTIGGDLPIGAYTSKKLYVDVYTYNNYADTYYMNQYPDFTYEIGTAVADEANPYAGSQNWHVFNIIPDDPTDPTDGLSDESEGAVAEEIPGVDMWLVPVEDMQVDDCAIKEQVYPSDIGICVNE